MDVMSNSWFAFISFNSVCVTNDPQNLFNILCDYSDKWHEVFSVNTEEEAHIVAEQMYYARFYGHPDCFEHIPMTLPTTGAYFISASPVSKLTDTIAVIRFPSEELAASQASSALPLRQMSPYAPNAENSNFAWSISTLNAVGIESHPSRVVGILSDKRYIYPHAMWWAKLETASFWAQKEYADRLARCYSVRDSNLHSLESPLQSGEMDIDNRIFPNGDAPISHNAVFQHLRDYAVL